MNTSFRRDVPDAAADIDFVDKLVDVILGMSISSIGSLVVLVASVETSSSFFIFWL